MYELCVNVLQQNRSKRTSVCFCGYTAVLICRVHLAVHLPPLVPLPLFCFRSVFLQEEFLEGYCDTKLIKTDNSQI